MSPLNIKGVTPTASFKTDYDRIQSDDAQRPVEVRRDQTDRTDFGHEPARVADPAL
jgi:hypothetical protein